MKTFIFLLCLFFIFSGCDSKSPSSTENGGADGGTGKGDGSSNQVGEYNIACKCKGLEPEPVTAKSTAGEEHAKLLAGAICVALQPEKETVLKEEADITEADKIRINSIIQNTLQNALTDGVDESALNTIYDCVPN